MIVNKTGKFATESSVRFSQSTTVDGPAYSTLVAFNCARVMTKIVLA